MKQTLQVSIFISLLFTIAVPITGIHLHKVGATLFVILSAIYAFTQNNYSKKVIFGFLGFAVLIFVMGLLGMINAHIPALLSVHKALSLLFVAMLIAGYITSKVNAKRGLRHDD